MMDPAQEHVLVVARMDVQENVMEPVMEPMMEHQQTI